MQLFAHKGYSETTVEDITNAADVGKGTFFNYFPSKDHILAAFGKTARLKKLQLAADARNHSPSHSRVFAQSLALDVISEPARNPAMVRVLMQANLSSEPVRETMRDIHTQCHRVSCANCRKWASTAAKSAKI